MELDVLRPSALSLAEHRDEVDADEGALLVELEVEFEADELVDVELANEQVDLAIV